MSQAVAGLAVLALVLTGLAALFANYDIRFVPHGSSHLHRTAGKTLQGAATALGKASAAAVGAKTSSAPRATLGARVTSLFGSPRNLFIAVVVVLVVLALVVTVSILLTRAQPQPAQQTSAQQDSSTQNTTQNDGASDQPKGIIQTLYESYSKLSVGYRVLLGGGIVLSGMCFIIFLCLALFGRTEAVKLILRDPPAGLTPLNVGQKLLLNLYGVMAVISIATMAVCVIMIDPSWGMVSAILSSLLSSPSSIWFLVGFGFWFVLGIGFDILRKVLGENHRRVKLMHTIYVTIYAALYFGGMGALGGLVGAIGCLPMSAMIVVPQLIKWNKGELKSLKEKRMAILAAVMLFLAVPLTAGFEPRFGTMGFATFVVALLAGQPWTWSGFFAQWKAKLSKITSKYLSSSDSQQIVVCNSAVLLDSSADELKVLEGPDNSNLYLVPERTPGPAPVPKLGGGDDVLFYIEGGNQQQHPPV